MAAKNLDEVMKKQHREEKEERNRRDEEREERNRRDEEKEERNRRDEEESRKRSVSGKRALDTANAEGALHDQTRLNSQRRYAEREEAREARRQSPPSDIGKGRGKPAPPSLPREFQSGRAPALQQGMTEEEEIRVIEQFHLGLRGHNPHVEGRRPDLGAAYKDGQVITKLDVYRYLVNPSKGNSRYTIEDKEGDRFLMELRAHFNKEKDLVSGLAFLQMIPSSPQYLGNVIDTYNGKDTSTTSGILVRRIGSPPFGCGFTNEVEWAPEVLTCLGRFPIGHHGVVAARYSYKYLTEDIANEACFIGEMWITLTSRDLAEYFMDVLSDQVFLNGNTEPVEVLWAGYMLSGKDLPRHGQMTIDKARVDHKIWEFPQQFDIDGEFLTNGPDTEYVRSNLPFRDAT